MEFSKGENCIKMSAKPSLAFSIDKIMGTTKTSDKKAETELNNESECVGSEGIAEQEVRDCSSLVESDKSSFKPVKRSKNFVEEDYNKQHEFLATQYQHAAAVIKNELHKRQMLPYMGRDMFDVNMNSVSCLHPAFMFGRMTPEEYRAQILQNISVLHNQWPNINKDNSHMIDSLSWSNMFPPTERKLPPDQEKTQEKNNDQQTIQQHRTPDYSPRSREEGSLHRSDGRASTGEDVKKVEELERAKEGVTSQGNVKRLISKSQKSFSCPECGKLFNAHYNLTRHMPVHTGIYIFFIKMHLTNYH